MNSIDSAILRDTICAIATPHGIGGIAVVRVSGPKSIAIADTIWQGRSLTEAKSHTAHFGLIVDPETGDTIDEAVATLFRAPASYTGDDTVEISVHGSRWIQRKLLQLLINGGARMAEPGEYTRRAFASGRLDLAQAEAVADLIAASSKEAHRIAMSQMKGAFSTRLGELRDKLLDLASLLELELDFSEEEVEFASRRQLRELSEEITAELRRLTSSFAIGSAIKEGIPVAIVGETNSGKSTLLNRLLGEERAIVSDIHGTTRDTIEDTTEIDGVMYRFIDTAGLRETVDPIEALGIDRAIDKAKRARIVLWIVDPTSSTLGDTAEKICAAVGGDTPIITVVNKSDLGISGATREAVASLMPDAAERIEISALNDCGLDALRSALKRYSGTDSHEDILVTNARHYEALTAALTSICRVTDGLDANLSGDFIAQDLRETIHHLSTITGTITTPDILSHIFSHFCIGK